MLGRIAVGHPKLRKLHNAIRDVDGPLYGRIKSKSFEQVVSVLSESVPVTIAQKIAMTPFLRDYPLAFMDMTEHHFTKSPLDEVIRESRSAVKEFIL